MNRNFLLLTGLLICCASRQMTLSSAQCVGGGDFPLLISGAGNILPERIVLSASRGGEAGKNNADPAPATAGITQARSRGKQGRTAGHRNGRIPPTGGHLARPQAKTPNQTVACAACANRRPAARTQRTARRKQPPPRNGHPGTLPGQYHQRQIPALLHATQHVLHQ